MCAQVGLFFNHVSFFLSNLLRATGLVLPVKNFKFNIQAQETLNGVKDSLKSHLAFPSSFREDLAV